MSTPTISFQAYKEIVNQTDDPVIYTAGGTDEMVVVHLYITLSPVDAAAIGAPTMAYTDEFGPQTVILWHEGSGRILSLSIPIRVKAGSTVSVNAQPSGDSVWSLYSAVEVLSTT